MDAAEAAGLTPLKVNVVLLRGQNDDEILDFASFARTTGRIVRFIEFMPLDAQGEWDRARLVPGREVFDRISARWPLRTVARPQRRSCRAFPLHVTGSARLASSRASRSHSVARATASGSLRTVRYGTASSPTMKRPCANILRDGRHRCRALPPLAGGRLGQTSRPWDQRAGVPQPVAIDVDDRRVAMARLRLFGPAREAAGTSDALVSGHDVAAIVAGARARFGEPFSTVLDGSRTLGQWRGGESRHSCRR